MPSWDPAIYDRYKAWRDRPALDLMVQIPDRRYREIWDLGCGTGEHAALLALRHPMARVHGLDSSPDMLREAKNRQTDVEWVLSGVETFAPATAPDLIFTNAALQWLPDHATLIPHLAGLLAPGGVFACQMPMAYETEHHRILRETAGAGPWAHLTAHARRINPTPSLDAYFDGLSGVCGEVDLWTTTYLHPLEGDDPVVDWMRGTALRPYLDVLAGHEAMLEAFLDAFRARIGEAFPPRPDGITLFPFPRLCMVATR